MISKGKSDDQKKKTGGNVHKKRNKPKEEVRKSYKLIIRKLPSAQYDINAFTTCLKQVLQSLSIKDEEVDVLHYMPGKLSRKRGAIPAVGFISIKDDASLLKFLKECPAHIKFLDGESAEAQPTIQLALYQKKMKKTRADRLNDTIEADKDYLQYVEESTATVQKLRSAEVQLEQKERELEALAATGVKPPPPTNALLEFLRDKDTKKILRKKAAAAKNSGGKSSRNTGSNISASSSQAGGKTSSNEKHFHIAKDNNSRDKDTAGAGEGKQKRGKNTETTTVKKSKETISSAIKDDDSIQKASGSERTPGNDKDNGRGGGKDKKREKPKTEREAKRRPDTADESVKQEGAKEVNSTEAGDGGRGGGGEGRGRGGGGGRGGGERDRERGAGRGGQERGADKEGGRDTNLERGQGSGRKKGQGKPESAAKAAEITSQAAPSAPIAFRILKRNDKESASGQAAPADKSPTL